MKAGKKLFLQGYMETENVFEKVPHGKAILIFIALKIPWLQSKVVRRKLLLYRNQECVKIRLTYTFIPTYIYLFR